MMRYEFETATSTRLQTRLKLGFAFFLFGGVAFSLVALSTLNKGSTPSPSPNQQASLTEKNLIAGQDYIPGSLIVQFKSEALTQVNKLGQDLRDGAINEGGFLSSLLGTESALVQVSKQNELHALTPEFSNLPSAEQLTNQFPKRERRAASNAHIPNLQTFFVLSFPEAADIPTVAKKYQMLPEVESAEPNYIYHLAAAELSTQTAPPNDPYYTSVGTAVPNVRDQWNLPAIHAEEAWQISQGDPNIIVAVSDTGIQTTHPDLQGRIWSNNGEMGTDSQGRDRATNGVDDDRNGYVDDTQGWNFNNGNKDITDRNGHGTHVAGIIGATTNNALGVAGIDWQSKIMPVKGLGDSGIGSTDNLAQTILYATNMGADVINMSWIGFPSASVTNAVYYAHAHGVVLVAAAGNDNVNVIGYTPAKLPPVIATAATGSWGGRVIFSNWGDKINLAAPGNNVFSLKVPNTSVAWSPRNDDFGVASGTSMAAPHVAGVAALMLSVAPSLTPDLVQIILEQTAHDIEQPGKDVLTGYGLVDAQAAVASARDYAAQTPRAELFFGINSATAALGSATASADYHTAQITADIINAGYTPASFQYKIYAGNPETGLVAYAGTITALQPQTTTTINQQVPANGFTPQYTLVMDPDNAVPEYNKTNNRLAVQTAFASPPGWPKTTNGAFETTPTITDVDRDGNLDVVAASRDGYIYVWRRDGSTLPGWPQVISWPPVGSPVIADLDNDGTNEMIVMSNEARMYIYRANGALVPGWPRFLDPQHAGPGIPAVGDIDGDGRNDIVISLGRSLYAIHLDGTVVSGWPKPLDYSAGNTPVITDIDHDGTNDVVFADGSRTQLWHGNGTPFAGWPVVGARPTRGTRAVLADLNGDGRDEILAADLHGSIYAWHIDGTRVNGWPVNWPTPDYNDSYHENTSPAVADVDRDGRPEIFAATNKGRIFAWHADGSPVAGWPQTVDRSVINEPAFADIDGNGKPEIFVESGSGKIFIWHGDGTPVVGSPQNIGNSILGSSPTVADLDRDGFFELFIGGEDRKLHRWILPGAATMQQPWPTLYHDQQRVGQYAGSMCNPTTCPDMNGDTHVDASDLSAFAAAKATQNLRADFNGDGLIDIYDQNVFASLLGSTNYSCTNRCAGQTTATGDPAPKVSSPTASQPIE